MDKKLKEIVLASYLHDVGKFAQRADRKELFDEKIKELSCPVTKDGRNTHWHVVYTNGFLEKHKNVLPDEIDFQKVIILARNHHRPSTYEEWVVAQGDRLSSGADRCSLLEEDDTESKKFFEKPLIHILSTLKIGQNEEPARAYCKMQPLDEDAILSTSSAKIGKEDYARLWNDFEKDFRALEGLSFEQFLPALDSLLERYWWCIPSATNSDADISLYQHAKTTAAFASALYEFQKSAEKENETDLQNTTEKKFLFIKGDLSGIQKYIFDLKSNDDSAKLLRAKSFEIAALGEIVAQNIVARAEVSSANIMTSAGGNFMILLPNSQKVRSLLPQIQLEAESYFLQEFAGKLSVIISDGVEASCDDVQQKKAQDLINQIGRNADICKQKKMQKALQKNGAVLNGFYEKLQKYGECPKCALFAADGTNADGSPKECSNCASLTEIGSRLVKSSWIKYDFQKLLPFSKTVKVFKNDEKPAGDSSESFFASINDFVPGRALVHLPYSAPRAGDEALLSFEEIAKKSTGNKKLAMFKADIDNLGLIFSSSLKERMSFSRYADMSHKMHYFFSAYYTWFLKNHSCEMTEDNGAKKKVFYKDAIYTVFSGGDDLCVLGAWDAVVQFAYDFHKELLKLTNNNPSLNLSGAIELSSSNTPVRMLAQSAEAALEKSKSRKDDSGKIAKNAITIFGTTVSWQDFEECLENGKKFQKYLEPNDKGESVLSTAVVYKMIDFSKRAEAIQNGSVKELVNENVKGQMKNHLWKSNFSYIVARNVKDKGVKEWLLDFAASPKKMASCRIAVSYALYTCRR